MSNHNFENECVFDGLFVPRKNLRVFFASKKRPETFLMVYPDLLRLPPKDMHTFMVCLQAADTQNKLAMKARHLTKVLNLSHRRVFSRLNSLKELGGFKGEPPLIFLNPYYGSKCGATTYKEICREWDEEIWDEGLAIGD